MKNFPKNSRKFSRFFWKNRIRVRFFKYHFCKKLIKSFFCNKQPAIPHRERSEPSAHAPLTVPAEQNSGVSKGLRSDKKNGLRHRIIAALYAKPEAGSFAGYQLFGDAPVLRMGDIMPGRTFAA